MKTLVIIGSHNKSSFNNSIKERVVEELKQKNHEIIVRDLYELQFDPVLTTKDFERLQTGNLPSDIKTEQDYISWAEKIVVIYPVWWTGLPAILKGYFDRVLLYGFAYKFDDKGLVKLLEGKEALIFSTSGMPKEAYESIGMYDAMKLTSDTGIFDFTGIKVKKHIFFPSVTSVSDDVRKTYLEETAEEIKKF